MSPTDIIVPLPYRRLTPMPIFFGNAWLSFLAVCWFFENLTAYGMPGRPWPRADGIAARIPRV
jgi:hypothetical protein